jgi:methylphosphotriester-DNA--protein-cysteine methyltransferase
MQNFEPETMPEICLREYLPSPELQPYVQSFWTGDFNTASVRNFSQSVVPNGYAELIIHLTDDHCELFRKNAWGSSPDCTLLGLYTRPYAVKFNTHVKVFGIRFNPEGIYNIFGVSPSEFLEGFEDMERVAGTEFAACCARLKDCRSTRQRIRMTEAFLLRNLDRHSARHDYVRTAAAMIRKNSRMKMEALHERIPISPRQLQREFKARIGISPKAYMRIARMNAIQQYLNTAVRIDLTAVTYDYGFSDQSHMIKEFHTLTGSGPGKFLKDRRQFLVNPGIIVPDPHGDG